MKEENKIENEKPTLKCPIAYAAVLINFDRISRLCNFAEVKVLFACVDDCAWYDKEEGRCGCLWS